MPRLEIQQAFDNAISQYREREQAGFPSLESKTEWGAKPVLEVAEEAKIGGGTLLGKMIDVLSRGEYASAALAKDYMLGKPFDVKSAIKGLKGEEKGTYDELMPALFPEWGKWKQKAMGLSLAIFADPTTYIPMGVIAKGTGKGIKAVKATKAAEKAMETKLAKGFIPSAGLPKPYYEMKYYAKKGLEAEQERILDDIKYLSKGLNTDDMKRLSYFREHPDKVADMPYKLQTKLEQIGSRFDGLIDEGVEKNIITADTAAKWKQKEIPYMAHYYPERGINIVSGKLPPGLFDKVKKPSFLKQRKFETLEDAKGLSDEFLDISKAKTIEEANEKIAQYGLTDAFGKGQVTDFKDLKNYAKAQSAVYKPEENILKSLGIRRLEQVNVIAKKQFVDNALSEFGMKVKAGTKVVPEGQGIYLPKGALRFYGKEYLEPNFVRNLRGLADKLQDLRIKTEKISEVKKTTETTITGGVKLAESGPTAKLEGVMRDALTNRGMTTGEADVYISKLKAGGSSAVDDIIREITEKSEITKTSLSEQFLEKDLIDVSSLSEVQLRRMVGVSGKVPTYMMPESVARDMNRASALFSGDPATRGFWKLFDKGQNAWKGMATVMRLPFHLRNMYSNWWQAWLAGVNNPQRFIQAAGIQSGALKEIKLGNKIFSYGEIKKAIEDFGIHGKGWAGADIPVTYFNELESIINHGKLRHLNPMKLGRKFGVMIEDNSRIATFLDQIAKGKSFKDASRSVRKYLFDYTELTDFEKKVMRRVFPFYTWSRKNIPLQIQNVLSQPRKYQAYAKGTRAFQEPETQEELRLKPDYFQELLYVQSPFKTSKGKPMYMSIDLPPQEFNRLSSIRHWVSSMSPYKLLAEVGLNIKTFPEISKIKEYPMDMGTAPFWVAYLPKKIQSKLTDWHIVDKIMNKETGEMMLGMDKKWRHAFQTAFPFLNELNRIYAQPITLDDERPEMKWRAYLSGIGFSALDTVFQEKQEIYDKMGDIKNIQKFVSQHGREPNKKEMEILAPNLPELRE